MIGAVPIYEYRCDHCGNAFSAVQSYKDDPLSECPRCGKAPRRVMSAPAIVFKGSGWYKTDSRASTASAVKDGAKTGEAKSETKADTKAGEAKSETKSESTSGSKPSEGKSSETKPAA
jgi:putative FmdB family regulatory protein